MVILGIDPGFAIVGFGLIEAAPGCQRALRCGAINTQAGLPLSTRLLQIANDMEAILAQFKPDAMAIEELFFNTNVTTGIGVAQALSLIHISSCLHGMRAMESCIPGMGPSTSKMSAISWMSSPLILPATALSVQISPEPISGICL